MFHFLHTVGVKHFDLVHDVLIHDAVHIGEGDAVPRCEGGQLAEMALVVVRRNDQIIGAGRAELAAGGDLQAGVAPLAHHRQVNADGGVNGKQLELSFQDSQGDPESAVAAYGKLMDWGMDVSLGCVMSGETASVVAAAKEDDVLLLTPSGSSDSCLSGNDKAFRICFYDSYQGTAAANYLSEKNLATEVGVLYQSDSDYSTGLYSSFVAECADLGINIVETQTFTASTSTDFSTQVNALVDSGVKVVFIPFYAEEASTFLTQAKGKFADDVYFFGADGLDGILGKVEQDVSIANNVLMLTPFAADSTEENVQSFVKAYEAAYGATPDQFAADAYDAVYVILSLIHI